MSSSRSQRLRSRNRQHVAHERFEHQQCPYDCAEIAHTTLVLIDDAAQTSLVEYTSLTEPRTEQAISHALT